MPRVDRNHEGADSKYGHRRPDQPGQRDRIVVELLSQPDLVDATGMGAFGLGHHVVDDVDGLGVGI